MTAAAAVESVPAENERLPRPPSMRPFGNGPFELEIQGESKTSAVKHNNAGVGRL